MRALVCEPWRHAEGEGGDAEEGGDAREVREREQSSGQRWYAEACDATHRDGQQTDGDHDEANAGDDGQAAEVAHKRQRHEAHAAQQHQRAIAVAEWQLDMLFHQVHRLHLE